MSECSGRLFSLSSSMLGLKGAPSSLISFIRNMNRPSTIIQILGNNSLFTCWCGDGGLEERKPLKGEIKLAALMLPSCHGVLYMPSKYSSKCVCCSTFDILLYAALPQVFPLPSMV
ncbi:hypothetical protein VPH35_077387 [Triticum aestivum]